MTASLSLPARTARNRRAGAAAINPLQLSRVFLVLLLTVVFGAAGLCFVSLKNTQHALGERVRETERQLREFRARNLDFQSRIESLSSRMALRRKIEGGFIAMVPVPATAIARLTPPVYANDGDASRTAAIINPVARP